MGETIEIRTENPLAAAPVSRLLLQFAIPSVLAMLVDALYNVVDQIFIGQGVGYLGIAAATVTFPFVTMILSIATLLGIGGSVYASMRMGAGKREEAEKALGTVFTLAAALGILFTAACLLFLKPLALAFGATEGVQGSLAYVLDYAPIILLGAPFSMAAVALSSMARADGSPVLAMGCFLAGAILNLILDPVYIFVLGWGVRGAAIATVIGQSLAGVIGLALLMRGKNAVTVTLRGFRWNGRIVRDIYTVGLPSILMQSIGSVTAMGFNRILMGLSDSAVWVMGTYSKLENFLFMPLFGLTHGVLPLTGYNFGAKNRDRMLQTMRYGLIIGISMMAVGMLIFWIFPRQLLGIFAPTPELMEMGVPALRTISLSFCLGAVGIILSTVFQAVGKGVYSLYISLLRQIVVVLPCAWALSFLGLEYVWFAFPVSNVVSMALSIVMARRLFRNYIDPILLDKGEAAR